MAEPLRQPSAPIAEPPLRRPVRVEFEPDGTVILWVDPRCFNVAITNGRGSGTTAELCTRIVISPWLAPATGVMAAHSRETDLTK